MQSVLSSKLILRRYQKHERKIEPTHIVILFTTIFAIIFGAITMIDLFGSYPKILLVTSFFKSLTKINSYGASCFDSLKEILLDGSIVHSKSTVFDFPNQCPLNLISLKMDHTKVVS